MVENAGITADTKPLLVKFAEKLSSNKAKAELVRVKHQTTCFMLLVANLAAELRHLWL